jgi:hypothetical protein
MRKPTHSFHCRGCGAGLEAQPPRGATALKLDAWFMAQKWDPNKGRPLCAACKGSSSSSSPAPSSGVRPKRQPRICVTSDELVNGLRESLEVM